MCNTFYNKNLKFYTKFEKGKNCNLNKEFLIIYRSFNTIIFIRHNKEEQMNKSTLFCYALYLFKYFRTKQFLDNVGIIEYRNKPTYYKEDLMLLKIPRYNTGNGAKDRSDCIMEKNIYNALIVTPRSAYSINSI